MTVAIKAVCFLFHVSRVSHTGFVLREDCSGSVSAHLVAQVSVVDRRPTDPKLCDAESAGRLRTPLQTSSSKGTSGRGGCEPGRLRPPYPPGLSRSCIALEHAQGHGVRSAQNVGTRGSGDPGAGALGQGGHRSGGGARPSGGSTGRRCGPSCSGSRGGWARSSGRHGTARTVYYVQQHAHVPRCVYRSPV